MQVSSDSHPDNVVLFPSTSRKDEYIRHKFYVPGLLFILFVGKTLPDFSNIMGIAPNPVSVFYSANWLDEWFMANAVRAAKSKRVGKFKLDK